MDQNNRNIIQDDLETFSKTLIEYYSIIAGKYSYLSK